MVLIDIEWVKNKNGDSCLSQIAAIKATSNWDVIDRYATIVKPLNASFTNWSQIGFTGWKPQDFLQAIPSQRAIQNFAKWIETETCFLFWDSESSEIFRSIFESVLKDKNSLNHVIINPYVAYVLSDYKVYKMNQYQVANRLDIPSGRLQHNAINDVDTFLSVLKTIKVDVSLFDEPAPAIEKTVVETTSESKPVELLPYQIDTDEKVLHKAGCPLLVIEHHRKGYRSIDECLRKQIKACPECIADELYNARRNYNERYLSRSKKNYVYLPGSVVFHRPDCSRVLSAPNINTLNTYKRCIEKGMQPCPKCKPEPEYTQMDAETYESRLTQDEQSALARHRQINLEREAALQSGFGSDTERNDMFTLTQPEYSFWAGKGYKTFHIRSCSKLSDARNLIGFKKFRDAIKARYTPCKYCKPSPEHNVVVSIPYQNTRREDDSIEILKELCLQNGLIFKQGKTVFEIITSVGLWKIEIYSMPIQVHHLSLKHKHGQALHYHKQPRVFLSYKDVFDYILRHDNELVDLVARKKIFVEPRTNENGGKDVVCPLCRSYISSDVCYEISLNAEGVGSKTGVPGIITREEIDEGASVCKKCMYHN